MNAYVIELQSEKKPVSSIVYQENLNALSHSAVL